MYEGLDWGYQNLQIIKLLVIDKPFSQKNQYISEFIGLIVVDWYNTNTK